MAVAHDVPDSVDVGEVVATRVDRGDVDGVPDVGALRDGEPLMNADVVPAALNEGEPVVLADTVGEGDGGLDLLDEGEAVMDRVARGDADRVKAAVNVAVGE